MKKGLLIIFVAFCFLTSAEYSMGFPVQLVNSDFHVWGSTQGDSYDTSSNFPVGGSCSYVFVTPGDPSVTWDAGASSYADYFNVSGMSSRTSHVAASGYADTDIIFRPLNDASEIIVIFFNLASTDGSGTLDGELLDISTATAIWTAHWWLYSGNHEQTIAYDFVSDHLYRLHLNLFVATGDPGFTSGRAGTDDLQRVPEPTAIILLGLGLMGLAGVRRKLKR